MSETFHVIPITAHEALVKAAYLKRGFDASESEHAAKLATAATKHGIRTHNAIKALHLDELFGSMAGGCRPGVSVRKLPTRFKAVEIWDAEKKLGQAVAWDAIETCMKLADTYGTGTVSVDNAFHYLWGGGYVMEAARKGYIAYTNCTSALAEVVPFKGRFPTLGTNPHSWGFPTTDSVGFPIVIDWATSVIAMGRVQQLKREGKPLPANAAVDADGYPTIDPEKAVSLLPFGDHKGYGLSLINELVAAFVGGSLPTLRNRPAEADEKRTCVFFFQVIHPDAISGGAFAKGRSQAANVKAVLADILGHGNEPCMLPGQAEAEAAARSEKAGGLFFSRAEVEALNKIAHEAGIPAFDITSLPTA
ncbi:MAG: Ldh family oxidoreductase [Planctomycetia bacterium]